MRCRHPRASELLVAQRHDPDESVRVSVVQALARLPRAQAGPLLMEMTKDSSGAVRDAAQRYLNALQQAAAATKK
jgi:HEAT repeat protein